MAASRRLGRLEDKAPAEGPQTLIVLRLPREMAAAVGDHQLESRDGAPLRREDCRKVLGQPQPGRQASLSRMTSFLALRSL
jgi:hypothetical protein